MRLISIGSIVVALLLFGSVSNAQTPVPSPTPQTSPQPLQLNTSDPARPLYGLQGVLVETLDGKVIASQADTQTFNPASAVKLATALAALQTLGPWHRFSTGIWTDGVLDKATGIITGNLYVSGRDPSFHYEHAISVARELNQLGIKQVTGDLVVSPDFNMNFNWSAIDSGVELYNTLDSKLRTAAAIQAWTYERTILNDRASLATVPSVAVMGEVTVGPVAPIAKLVLTQKSSQLVDILKVLLCYSNNFMAERLGETLGGPDPVRQQLITRLGIAAGDLRLSSLSGLGVNRVTPRAMMKILRALRSELAKNKLSPSAIMPVAGIDPGTLQDRFTGKEWRGSVIAKTGTLGRTDGGASSLVGQLRAADGEVLLFVIMNQDGDVVRFRENQDYLVMLIQNSRGGPKAFDYRPSLLMMQLSNTESTVAAGEEFEPKTKSQH